MSDREQRQRGRSRMASLDGFFHRCCRLDAERKTTSEEESMLDRRSRGRAKEGSENEQLE